MSEMDDRCGTYAGEQAHRKRGEKPCVFCASAKAEYMKAYRSDPERLRRHVEGRDARMAALQALSHRHQAEYQRLYTQALAELRGIEGAA